MPDGPAAAGAGGGAVACAARWAASRTKAACRFASICSGVQTGAGSRFTVAVARLTAAVARQCLSAAESVRALHTEAAASAASSAARSLAGDGWAAGSAARANCPILLRCMVGSASDAEEAWQAEAMKTGTWPAAKTGRYSADQKLRSSLLNTRIAR